MEDDESFDVEGFNKYLDKYNLTLNYTVHDEYDGYDELSEFAEYINKLEEKKKEEDLGEMEEQYNNKDIGNSEELQVNEVDELSTKIEQLQEKLKKLTVTNSINDLRVAEKFIIENKDILDESTMVNFINRDISRYFKFDANEKKQLVGKLKDIINVDGKETNQYVQLAFKTPIEKIKESKELTNFSIGQDFKQGKLIYGFISNDESYIITSNQELESLANVESNLKLKPNSQSVELSKLKSETILQYIEENKTITKLRKFYNIILEFYKKYIYFDDGRTYDVLTVWTMYTYIYKAFPFCAYLSINADKGSGKTLLLELLQDLCFNAQMTTNVTSASIFRYVEVANATLLLDEFENIKDDKNSELRTVLNSGFKSEGKVPRQVTVDDDYKTKFFSSYSPKAFAGINDIDDVLKDRCIVINLLKMPKEKKIVRYKKDSKLSGRIDKNVQLLYMFGLTYCSEIKELYEKNEIECPQQLSYRDRDIWEPLLCVARVIDSDEETVDAYGIEDVILSYAIDKSKERSKSDIEENKSYKLLKDLLEMVRENKIQPIIIDNKKIYNNEDLLEYMNGQCEHFFKNTQSLTKALKNRLHINSERYTLEGKKYRGYVFDKVIIEDLASRYNIL